MSPGAQKSNHNAISIQNDPRVSILGGASLRQRVQSIVAWAISSPLLVPPLFIHATKRSSWFET
jgi:hypothetical protein